MKRKGVAISLMKKLDQIGLSFQRKKGLFLQRVAGFTLVEIMIVVGIIALLASLAIPNFLKSRIHSNEGVTQDALKTIATAEISFRSANSVYASLEELGSATPPYIDTVLSGGERSGYTFTITDIDNDNTFHCSAKPNIQNITGVRSFCITEDGVVRVKIAGGDIDNRGACLLLSPSG